MNIYGRPWTILQLAFHYKDIKRWGYLKILVYFFKQVFSLPFIALEWLFGAPKIKASELKYPPIFILGHYRSGTTLLHKLLASDPRRAVIHNYDLLFSFHPNWLKKVFQPVLQRIIDRIGFQQPAFNNVPYSLADPNEDDIYFIHFFSSLSAYWGYLFPRKALKLLHQEDLHKDARLKEKWGKSYLYHIKKLSLKKGGRQLVLKSPPHTARIDLLLKLFPNARFIFLHRDPVTTFYATKKLWQKTILRYYCLQEVNDNELEDIIFSHYRYLVGSYQSQKHRIPEEQLIELSYEALQSNPTECLKKIYDSLHLGDFEEVIPHLQILLGKESGYQKSTYCLDPLKIAQIQKEWEDFC